MKNLMRILIKNITCIQEFGLRVWAYRFLFEYIYRQEGQKRNQAEHNFYEACKNWLRKNYGEIIKKYQNTTYINQSIKSKDTIWIMWWQGLDKAPDVVKICYKAVIKNSAGKKVIMITKENFQCYADIPEYILKKVDSGQITITHLSDIIRVALLSKWGGIWIDATVLCTVNLPDYEDYLFYTINHNFDNKLHVCKGKWSGFYMVAEHNTALMNFCYDMFCEYWKKQKSLIGYLLIDCVISIAYEDIMPVKTMIENVPVNNELIFELSSIANQVCDYNKIQKILEKNYLHKLSWKKEYVYTVHGKKTNIGIFLD